MFETSVVRDRAMGAHHRYRLLTLSLGFHASAIAVVLAATLASTRLPEEAPRQMAFPPVMPVVDLAPPAAFGVPHPRPASRHPHVVTAPVVPSLSGGQPPSAVQPQPATDTSGSASSTETGDQDGPPGSLTGTPGGIGTADGTGAGQAADAAGPLRVEGDVKAPIVLQRAMPEYPRVAMMSRMCGTVTVECIIDKTGHCREAHVVKSTFAAFDQPAIDAVQRWLFAPGTLHGQPVDTIFQLTVVFQVK